jgi:hypothetical protein
MFQLLNGKPLFGENVDIDNLSEYNAFEIVTAQKTQTSPAPTAGKEPLLDALISQLLQKSPDLRYQTGISVTYFPCNT